MAVEIAKSHSLKRVEYPADIVNLVRKIRQAAYKDGVVNLKNLFTNSDTSKSGSLDFDEFKLMIRGDRYVDHACHCARCVNFQAVSFVLSERASCCVNAHATCAS